MGLNHITIQGNLTRDPNLTYLPSQTAVVDFGLACNRKWKDQSGQDREEVCFVDCQAFGKTAENIAKFFKKGRAILVVGRLKLDQWETPEGDKRSKHKITVAEFHFVDSQKKSDDGGGYDDDYGQAPPRQQSRSAGSRTAPANAGRNPTRPPQQQPPKDDFYGGQQDANFDDDIPF
jgi:single-strand DNA-binding protein